MYHPLPPPDPDHDPYQHPHEGYVDPGYAAHDPGQHDVAGVVGAAYEYDDGGYGVQHTGLGAEAGEFHGFYPSTYAQGASLLQGLCVCVCKI